MTAQEQTIMLDAPAGSEEQFDLWIEAGHTEKNYWRDLWRYRELFYFLAWRDILVRYKQTLHGGL
jgi:lipopolysaccharide transport system permease protein